jgi:hypothetical protein
MPTPPQQLTTYVWGNGAKVNAEEIPKIIWLYWHDGDMPVICQQCIKRAERLNPDFKINIVGKENAHSFLPELSSIDLKNSNIPIANYSDLIRLSLLEKYGGFWLDASVILNTSLDYFIDLIKAQQAELVAFTMPKPGVIAAPISTLAYPNTETWFLGATKGSRFITDWKNEFISCLVSPNPVMYYKSDPDYLKYVENIPAALHDYLLVYISSKAIMYRNNKNYRLLFLNAYETGFLYSRSSFWNGEITVQLLTKLKKPRRIAIMIKLTSDLRRIAERSVTDKDYVTDSIIADLLKE